MSLSPSSLSSRKKRGTNKKNKKTYYNDIALKVMHQVLGLPYLHYGYFTNQVNPSLETLPQAQEKYVDEILALFPTTGVHRILDIGCGLGSLTEKLVHRGFDVTVVDPNPYMIQSTLEKNPPAIKAINDFYENVDHLEPGTFDLILMSESCQYINPDQGWALHQKHLRQGGHVIIADFFRIKPLDKPYLSKSGHDWNSFLNLAEKKYDFQLTQKIDITPYITPTMDIYQNIINTKIFPVIGGLFSVIQRSHPWIYSLLNKFFRSEVEKIKEKYSHQGGKEFTAYKAYYLLHFQQHGESLPTK